MKKIFSIVVVLSFLMVLVCFLSIFIIENTLATTDTTDSSSFNIHLNKKWNLISVPFFLLNDTPEETFKDIKNDLDPVWTYDASTGKWFIWTPGDAPDSLMSIEPGWGYWLSAKNETDLVIAGSLFNPGTIPPSRDLMPGWNLIGYYGADNQTGYYGPVGNGDFAYCALYSLVDTTSGLTKWSSLVTYWQLDLNPWYYLTECDNMDPGAGYWIEMDVGSIYAPATICVGDICP